MSDKMPWFAFFAADFLVGSAGMSAAAVGCYVRLLCHQWDRGSLPADLKALDRLVPGSKRAWPELAEKFVERDGELRNARLESERNRSQNLSAVRSKVGRNGAFQRWQTHSKGISKHDGKQQQETLANAMAKLCPSQSQSQSHSQPSPPLGGLGEGGGGEVDSRNAEQPEPISFAIGRAAAIRRYGELDGARIFSETVAGRRRAANAKFSRLGLDGPLLAAAIERSLAANWDRFSDELDALVAEANGKDSPAGWVTWKLGLQRTG